MSEQRTAEARARLTEITADDVADITVGAAILGTGGGGDPHIGGLLARDAIRRHGPVQVVSPDALQSEDLILPVALMGAPTVVIEKIPSIDQLGIAIDAVSRYLGRRPTHLACIEAGGINSTMPIAAAAALGLPLVDGDGMGRAFPEVEMVLPTLYGVSASPLSYADEKGNTGIVDTIDNRWAERLARPLAVEMGSSIVISAFAMSGAQVQESFVPHSLTLCRDLGVARRGAIDERRDPVQVIAEQLHGAVVAAGKVIDVQRRTEGGFARGRARLEGTGAHDGATVELLFQNENLVVEIDGVAVCTTPDLIIVVDDQTGEAITTEAVRYGQRVCVLVAPADERWHSPAGLALVGPRRFGYEIDVVRATVA